MHEVMALGGDWKRLVLRSGTVARKFQKGGLRFCGDALRLCGGT